MQACFQIAEHSLPYAKVTRIIDYKKDSWLFRHPCKFFKIGYLPLPNKIINFANVIKLDRHIEILLLENDCVIVPGLGGFVAHHVSARYDVNDGLFLPPYRTLGFNAQLKMNDSLLVQSYVDAYDMSYPEALRKVESEVDEIYRILGEEGFFELTDLGRLSRNHEGKLTFDPFESGILTPSYYGLGSFDFRKAAAVMGEESGSSVSGHKSSRHGILYIDESDGKDKRISISMRAVRNVTAAAAFLTAVFLVAFPGSTRNGVPGQQVKSGVLYNIFDSSDTFNTSGQFRPLRVGRGLSADNVQAASPVPSHYWAIVMASHVTESNARAFVARLRKHGLEDARVYEGAESMKVLCGCFSSQKEAYERMKIINATTAFKESWVIEIGK